MLTFSKQYIIKKYIQERDDSKLGASVVKSDHYTNFATAIVPQSLLLFDQIHLIHFKLDCCVLKSPIKQRKLC